MANISITESVLMDRLWVYFAHLANALPGCKTVMYVYHAADGNLVIPVTSKADNRFRRKLSAAPFMRLLDTTEDDEQLTASNLEPDLTALLLTAKASKSAHSLMARPLVGAGKLFGMLVMDIGDSDEQTKVARTNLNSLAHVIHQNLILENQVDHLQDHSDFLDRLLERSRSIQMTDNPSDLLQEIADLVREVVDFDRLTISTRSPVHPEGLIIDWAEGLDEGQSVGFEFTDGDSCHGAVFSSERGLLIDDLRNSRFNSRFEPGDLDRTQMQSFLGVPIVEAAQSKGVIAVESTKTGAFNEANLKVLSAIAQVYGTAMYWVQNYQEIRAMATVDGLTELLNHRSFMERLEEELSRISRYGASMTLLMMDLDRFKLVNDNFGHLFGDYVLRQTSKLIRDSIRQADIAGRIGGEEFAVIIINADKSASLRTAARIRDSIADNIFEMDNMVHRISVSIGMAEYPLDAKIGRDLLRYADDSMYQAKHRGGNRVVQYGQVGI